MIFVPECATGAPLLLLYRIFLYIGVCPMTFPSMSIAASSRFVYAGAWATAVAVITISPITSGIGNSLGAAVL